MSDFETVLYTVENRVATITLNRPQARNAFNEQLRLDLIAALRRAETDDEVRVLLLTGAGKGFGAGHDLASGFGEYSCIGDLITAQYKPFLMAIHESHKLVIAAVNGAAAGISGAMAMACDLVVMGESAYLYQAFLPIGLVQDGGTSWQLVNTIGYKRALQMILDAEKVPAQRCVDLGLANKVVADDQLLDTARSWAEQLAEGAPLAQRYCKQVLKQSMEMDLSETIDAEGELQNVCSISEDSMSAINAFFNKEKPVFKGR